MVCYHLDGFDVKIAFRQYCLSFVWQEAIWIVHQEQNIVSTTSIIIHSIISIDYWCNFQYHFSSSVESKLDELSVNAAADCLFGDTRRNENPVRIICHCFNCINTVVCVCIQNCYCRFFTSTTGKSKRGEIFKLFHWRHLVRFETWTTTFRSCFIIIETTNQWYNSRLSQYMRQRTEMNGDHNRWVSVLLFEFSSILWQEWRPLSREQQFDIKNLPLRQVHRSYFPSLVSLVLEYTS